MNRQIMAKASVFILALFMTTVSCTAAWQVSQETRQQNPEPARGWYWKEPYPNYAPAGVPDFDQQQNNWQKITAGPNTVIESTVAGDDVYNTDTNCIAPGPNCQLESVPAGDDVVKWAFCGPVAVANCLWWYDSQFSDPMGLPGDGNDTYVLVEDYGVGDDHSPENVPYLVENLANTMGTCQQGTTNVSMMTTGITDWLQTTGLDVSYELNDYMFPAFDFVSQEIERSQNVILLLGFYEYVVGDKVIDQEQNIFPAYMNDQLQTQTWWDYQTFTPNVSRLDAIQLCLVSNGPPCEIEINVYDTFQGTPLGTSVLNPGIIATPTWIQFHFDPTIPLTPNSTYYFDVRQVQDGPHYEWFYANDGVIPGDPYVPGQGWMDTNTIDYYGLPFDWTFRTEYYDPPPTVERREGHFVTSAGVDEDGYQIAICDPAQDMANTTSTNHNDAQNVSHDPYNVTIGTPHPDLPATWWLPDYNGPYDYCVVEHAIVLCYVPDTEPPQLEIITPIDALYFMGQEVVPLPFPFPLVIGPITVEAVASDNRTGISKVEFIVDDVLQHTCTSPPYTWTWEEFGFFIYNLRVTAYDGANNYVPITKAVIKIL